MNIDPIADILVRINNAILVKRETVEMPLSKLKQAIAEILVREGYLVKYEVDATISDKAKLILTLKYYADQSVIHGLKQISKPGHRIYRSFTQLTNQLSSQAEDIIISTSRGLMTLREAKSANLGGEVLFKVW